MDRLTHITHRRCDVGVCLVVEQEGHVLLLAFGRHPVQQSAGEQLRKGERTRKTEAAERERQKQTTRNQAEGLTIPVREMKGQAE